MKPLFGIARAIRDFALPPRCPACGVVVEGDHRFCLGCWGKLDFLSGEGCFSCGAPLPANMFGELQCGRCLSAPPRYDGVRAAVAYGETARHLVLKLKYGRRPALAETVARHLIHHVETDDGGLLMPVPLHRWRLWSRGYNQSLLIARHLSQRTGLPLSAHVLIRSKHTPVLRSLGRSQRAKAVQGAFRIAPEHRDFLSGKTIWLVDDVYTSGATANACAATLKKAGAARVMVLCWARVTHSDVDIAGQRSHLGTEG